MLRSHPIVQYIILNHFILTRLEATYYHVYLHALRVQIAISCIITEIKIVAGFTRKVQSYASKILQLNQM